MLPCADRVGQEIWNTHLKLNNYSEFWALHDSKKPIEDHVLSYSVSLWIRCRSHAQMRSSPSHVAASPCSLLIVHWHFCFCFLYIAHFRSHKGWFVFFFFGLCLFVCLFDFSSHCLHMYMCTDLTTRMFISAWLIKVEIWKSSKCSTRIGGRIVMMGCAMS